MVRLDVDSDIVVGALGKIRFSKGTYAYVGSAMNGWRARVDRHLRAEKKVRWHIDYLLERGEAMGYAVWTGKRRRECGVARALAERFEAVPKFGCSDCGCGSHLFHLGEQADIEKLDIGTAAPDIVLKL